VLLGTVAEDAFEQVVILVHGVVRVDRDSVATISPEDGERAVARQAALTTGSRYPLGI
jgi:hypothetical protein